MLSGYRKVPERRHGFGRWSSTQARESTQESVREQGHAGAHFALPLAARWLKTIEFDQTFLISLKESVTSGTHPNEVVQFETIAAGPFPSSSFKGLVERSASPEGLNIHRLVKLGSLPEVPFRVLLA